MLMLGVNDVIETNGFLSSVNTSANARVNDDVQCEQALNWEFRIENTLWLINSYLFKVDSFRLIRLWHGVDFEHPATSIFKSFTPGDNLGEICNKFQLLYMLP